MPHDQILILDFGSQVTQLIARRVREAQASGWMDLLVPGTQETC
jgi:GMP synthase-like glutamine amidotransferase